MQVPRYLEPPNDSTRRPRPRQRCRGRCRGTQGRQPLDLGGRWGFPQWTTAALLHCPAVDPPSTFQRETPIQAQQLENSPTTTALRADYKPTTTRTACTFSYEVPGLIAVSPFSDAWCLVSHMPSFPPPVPGVLPFSSTPSAYLLAVVPSCPPRHLRASRRCTSYWTTILRPSTSLGGLPAR